MVASFVSEHVTVFFGRLARTIHGPMEAKVQAGNVEGVRLACAALLRPGGLLRPHFCVSYSGSTGYEERRNEMAREDRPWFC